MSYHKSIGLTANVQSLFYTSVKAVQNSHITICINRGLQCRIPKCVPENESLGWCTDGRSPISQVLFRTDTSSTSSIYGALFQTAFAVSFVYDSSTVNSLSYPMPPCCPCDIMFSSLPLPSIPIAVAFTEYAALSFRNLPERGLPSSPLSGII